MSASRIIQPVGFAFAVIVLFLLPFSAAAEVRISGHVTAGMGQYNNEPPGGGASSSDFEGEGEGEIDASASDGPVSARVRYRVREDGGGAITAIRHQVSWKTSDALTLDFYGLSFGLPASAVAYGVYSVGHFADGFPIGNLDPTAVGRFLDTTGVNVNFKFGESSAGVALLDSCEPACPGGAVEDSTFTIHFLGKFGSISVGAFLANAKEETSDATETNFQGVYDTGSMGLALEISTYGDSVDNKGNGMAFGVSVGAIGAHYVTYKVEDSAGTGIMDQAEISLAYTHKITDKSNLAIGYASWSDKITTQEQTDTLLIASLKSNF